MEACSTPARPHVGARQSGLRLLADAEGHLAFKDQEELVLAGVDVKWRLAALPSQDFGAAAAMTKQAMQYLVDDLEKLGHRERIPDPADRRAKLIRLTPRPRECVVFARKAFAATEAAWASKLGSRKMERLRAAG